MFQIRQLLIVVAMLSVSGVAESQPSISAEALLIGADARIERFRKGDVVIKVFDRSGEPVPGAKINVEQIRHQFLFGCNAFPLLGHSDPVLEQTYQREFSTLFNYATLGFYWGAYERQPGKPDRERLMRQARWCQEHDISVKGHPLVWHEVYPKWAPSEVAEVKRSLEKRVTSIVSEFRGVIDRWDVVNEATTSPRFDNGVGHWAKAEGVPAMVDQSLRWARRGNSRAVLVYNEYKLDDDYVKLANALFDKGSPVDVLGLQSHMHTGEWPLTRAWDVCEKFGRLGKPLHFTELTVLSGQHGYERPRPWPSTPDGEAFQADYVEKLYTLLFSHPAVQAITWWDFMDGAWQGAPAGLVHADLSPKPVYDRLMKLIKGKWWTNTEAATADSGEARLRIFGGRHRITVHSEEGSSTVEADIPTGKLTTIKVRVD